MTHVAKEIKRLTEEGENPNSIAEALGMNVESIEAIAGSMISNGEISDDAVTPQKFAQANLGKWLGNISALADYADSEGVRLEANKFMIEEATGRNAARSRVPSLSGVNVIMIDQAMKKAKRAVASALGQEVQDVQDIAC